MTGPCVECTALREQVSELQKDLKRCHGRFGAARAEANQRRYQNQQLKQSLDKLIEGAQHMEQGVGTTQEASTWKMIRTKLLEIMKRYK